MQTHPRLGRRAAGLVDVLQGLAHPARSGLQPLLHEAAFDLQLQFAQPGFVPEPQVLRPLQKPGGAPLGLADLVDGLVGVPGHMELVDDPPRVGQAFADALPEARTHVAGDEPHVPRHAIVVHEIPGEPFDRGRVPARGHVGHVVLDQIGDHGDVVVALAAGPVDADGLHARVVLQLPRLVDVVGDEPPQAGVGLVDPLGERAGGQVPGHLRGPRLNRSVNPPPGLAHGTGTVPTPRTGQETRGTPAWTNALYWKKSGCRHVRSRVSCTGQTVSPHPGSGQQKREPTSKPIAMCSSCLPSPASLKSTDSTFQGDCNCRAAVNR